MANITIKGGDLKGLKKYLEGYQGGPHGVKIGIFEEATFLGGPSDGEKIAPIAAIHEFGGGHVPPRSFLRSTVEENKKDWAAMGPEYLRQHPGDVKGYLNAVGLDAVGAATQKIEAGIKPLLTMATIAQKERIITEDYTQEVTTTHMNLPLVLTGSMLQSIAYQVDDGEKVYPNKGGS